ncbi:MAG: aldehyde ferredoxin oxidoreductase N-terminal domain-containing protein, partial [Chloroflexota bacterium]
MAKGYMGKIMRVNLTTGEMEEENLPSEGVLRSYLGCWGLGLRYLYNECPPGTAPQDPENPVIFLTGPLAATHMPGANNTTCVTLNFDTEITAGRAHTHGFFGPNLKFAGYDGIIITGRADKPVYLWLHDGKAEIREAGDIWGKDTHETEDLVKERVGEPSASVAAIGPAGENVCAGALIENDKNHSMSHSGVGAVMGSKKLKAIAVFGKNRDIPVSDGRREVEVAKQWTASLDYGPRSSVRVVGSEYKKHHRHEYEQSHVDRMGGVVAMNFKQWRLPGFVEDAINKVTSRSCFRCPIGCCYDLEIVSGPHKGYIATLAGGGEPIEAAGSIVGLMASGDVFYMVDLFDRLGLEASTAGCTIAMAFEAYEKGLITKEDTGGIELKWGDAEAM